MNNGSLINREQVQDNRFLMKKPRHGANVYGLPVSKELASFIEDASPDSQQQRLMTMFFAGRLSGTPVFEDFEQEEEF